MRARPRSATACGSPSTRCGSTPMARSTRRTPRVGLARLHAGGELDAALARIQNDLFDLGADLCRPDMEADAEAEYTPLRMTASQVDRLEAEIDAMNAGLAPLRSFVLPGGTALAAHLHLCRTVSRRAERLAVELGRARAGERPRAALSQPAVRLVLRRLARRERQRRGRRALGAWREPLILRGWRAASIGAKRAASQRRRTR